MKIALYGNRYLITKTVRSRDKQKNKQEIILTTKECLILYLSNASDIALVVEYS